MSAEGGDDGEAGRGNRINGLITPFRPMTMESAAGKNPVTHVGKLYNIAANLISQRLIDEIPGIDEARCLIVSQIGCPVDQPQVVHLLMRSRPAIAEISRRVSAIVEDEFSRLSFLAEALITGAITIGRHPLRQTIQAR
jgi:S-adenosylmethionine synthetase